MSLLLHAVTVDFSVSACARVVLVLSVILLGNPRMLTIQGSFQRQHGKQYAAGFLEESSVKALYQKRVPSQIRRQLHLCASRFYTAVARDGPQTTSSITPLPESLLYGVQGQDKPATPKSDGACSGIVSGASAALFSACHSHNLSTATWAPRTAQNARKPK